MKRIIALLLAAILCTALFGAADKRLLILRRQKVRPAVETMAKKLSLSIGSISMSPMSI